MCLLALLNFVFVVDDCRSRQSRVDHNNGKNTRALINADDDCAIVVLVYKHGEKGVLTPVTLVEPATVD